MDHLLSSEDDLLPQRRIEEISAPNGTDWDEWVSATKTRNYMLNDPVLDWLDYNCGLFSARKPNYTTSVTRALVAKNRGDSFVDYIMNQGHIFEEEVVRELGERFGSENIASIGGELGARTTEKVRETVDAMNNGVPIIHSGLLHNPRTRTYGIPDLIVRSDWINRLTTIDSIKPRSTTISAERLRKPHSSDEAPDYHYIIVDVKYSTLTLRADGVHLLNSGSFPAYKSQLHIYNEALGLIQGYRPPKTFILGRKWRYTSCGKDFKGWSCFDKLGAIDYGYLDESVIAKTKKAVEWIRDCRTPEAGNWNLVNLPLSRPELYPNMSNHHDGSWRGVKNKIAKEIGELTSLWMVGTKHRIAAHENGIYRWTDERCTPENLGFTGAHTRKILDRILEVNQPHRNPDGKYILPDCIETNFCNWKNPATLEFYVDFETVNNAFSNFDVFPLADEVTTVFMIGVGYASPDDGEWIYKEFTVNSLTYEEEKRICYEFAEFIAEESAIYSVRDVCCFHWAPAERNFWDDVMTRHPKEIEYMTIWNWVDLLKVFKDEPIGVKGALGYSLKQIAGALKKNGCIQAGWKGGSCVDGQGAMIGAWKAHKIAESRGISMKSTPQIKEVIKYNEVDVKVIFEIVEYLRKNHISTATSTTPAASSSKSASKSLKRIIRRAKRKAGNDESIAGRKKKRRIRETIRFGFEE